MHARLHWRSDKISVFLSHSGGVNSGLWHRRGLPIAIFSQKNQYTRLHQQLAYAFNAFIT